LHWTASRPGSQRVVWSEKFGLFQIASACPRAADGDRPRSALRPHLAKQLRGTSRPHAYLESALENSRQVRFDVGFPAWAVL